MHKYRYHTDITFIQRDVEFILPRCIFADWYRESAIPDAVGISVWNLDATMSKVKYWSLIWVTFQQLGQNMDGHPHRFDTVSICTIISEGPKKQQLSGAYVVIITKKDVSKFPGLIETDILDWRPELYNKYDNSLYPLPRNSLP